MRFTAICALAACLVFSACERTPRTNAAPERAEAAERDSYQDLAGARLKDFDHRFDGLDARLKGLNDADQQRLKIDIAELRDRKAIIERKLKDMKSVSEQSWRDIRGSLDRDMDQLELAYNVVAANNQGHPAPR
jgi:hypothetical protein